MQAARNVCPLMVLADGGMMLVPVNTTVTPPMSDTPQKLFNATGFAVAIDPVQGFVFWGEGKAIRRATLNGTDNHAIITYAVAYVWGIAVDSEKSNLYFTSYINKKVEVSKLDGSARRVLISPTSGNPRGIAVHSKLGFLVYAVRYTSINKANTDGSRDTAIVSTNVVYPAGLIIDQITRQICWADSAMKSIYCTDYNGNYRRVLVSGYTIHVALGRSSLYWTDGSSVGSINIDGTDQQTVSVMQTGMGGIVTMDWGCQPAADDCDPVIHGSEALDLEQETGVVFEVKTCSRVQIELINFLSQSVYKLEFATSDVESNAISIVATSETTTQTSRFTQDCTHTRQFWVMWTDDVISGGIRLSPGMNEVVRTQRQKEGADRVISTARMTTTPLDDDANFKIFRLSAQPILDPAVKMEQSIHLNDADNASCLSLASTDMYKFSTLSKHWSPQPQHACLLSGLIIKKCIPIKLRTSFTLSITGHGLVCTDTHLAVIVRQTQLQSCVLAGHYWRCKLSPAGGSVPGGLTTCVAKCLCDGKDCKHATIHIPKGQEDWRICEITVK